MLTINVGDLVAIKSGFASGYGGEGPRRFSFVLQVLEGHGAEIEEYDVHADLLDRVDQAALTRADLETLDDSRPLRPSRWHNYISERHSDKRHNGSLWGEEFPLVIPLAIVDSRIIDLALSFWDDPDASLHRGYRRLEDIVREKSGIDQHGTKLFSLAFNPNRSMLSWNDANEGELSGRMNLFTGTWAAHRNRRAHQESGGSNDSLLVEFLLLNHLYRLEKDSVKVESTPE